MTEDLTQKYEKKRWYVAPTDEMYNEARRLNTSFPAKKTEAAILSQAYQVSYPVVSVESCVRFPIVSMLVHPIHGCMYNTHACMMSGLLTEPQCITIMGSRASPASAPILISHINFLPSKSVLKLTITPWLSSFWMFSCSFTWWPTIHIQDSNFGVTFNYNCELSVGGIYPKTLRK